MKAFSAFKNTITTAATAGLNTVTGVAASAVAAPAPASAPHSAIGLSDSVKDSLRLSGIIHYLGVVESTDSRIAIEVYENEKWQPILQSWGNILGVHTNAFDRSPYSDKNGNNPLRGSLADMKPIAGYRWEGTWEPVTLTNKTDSEGFMYGLSWSTLTERLAHSAPSKVLFFRTRKLRRYMVKDGNVRRAVLPYELKVRIKYASFAAMNGSTSHSHMEVLYNDKLIQRTQSSPPEWDHNFTIRLIRVDQEAKITFWVFSLQVINVTKAITNLATVVGGAGSGSSMSGTASQLVSSRNDSNYWFRGEVTATVRELLSAEGEEVALTMTVPGKGTTASAVAIKAADLVLSVKLVSNVLCSLYRRPRKVFLEDQFFLQLRFRLGDRLFDRVMKRYRNDNRRSFFGEAVNHLLECDNSVSTSLIEYLLNEYEELPLSQQQKRSYAQTIPPQSLLLPHSVPDYRQLFFLVPFSSLSDRVKSEIPRMQAQISLQNDERMLTSNIASSLLLSPASRCALFPKFHQTGPYSVDVFHWSSNSSSNSVMVCYRLVWTKFMDYIDFLKHVARILMNDIRSIAAAESPVRLSSQEANIHDQPATVSLDTTTEAIYLTSSERRASQINLSLPFREVLFKANHLHHRSDTRLLKISGFTLSGLSLEQGNKKGSFTILTPDGGASFSLTSGTTKTAPNVSTTLELGTAADMSLFIQNDLTKPIVALKLTMVNDKDALLTNTTVQLPLRDIFKSDTSDGNDQLNVDISTQMNLPIVVNRTILRMSIMKMTNLVPVDFGATSDPYFKINLADQTGQIIAGNKEIYRSTAREKQLNPEWNVHVDIDIEKHASKYVTAVYAVIEVFDKNNFRTDVSLGEVFIPLQWFARDEILRRTLTLPIQPSKSTKIRKEYTSMGSVELSLMRFDPNSLPAKEIVNAKFVARLEEPSLTSVRWPAIFFSSQADGGIVEDGFSAFIAFDGLLIESAVDATSTPFVVVLSECKENFGDDLSEDQPPPLQPLPSPLQSPPQQQQMQQQLSRRQSITKKGVELVAKLGRQVKHAVDVATTTAVPSLTSPSAAAAATVSSSSSSSSSSSATVSLRIPFEQISKEGIFILGEATLLVRFTLKRIIKSAKFAQFQTKDFQVECMIGPCPAEQFAALLIAGIESASMKTAVLDATSSLSIKTMSIDDLNNASLKLYRDFNETIEAFRTMKISLQKLLSREAAVHGEGESSEKRPPSPEKGSNLPTNEKREDAIAKWISPVTGKRLNFTALQIRCLRIYFCFDSLLTCAAECTRFVDTANAEVTPAPEYTDQVLQQIVRDVEDGLRGVVINDKSNEGLNEFNQFVDTLLHDFSYSIRFMFVYFSKRRDFTDQDELAMLNKWIYAIYLPIITFLHDCLAYDGSDNDDEEGADRGSGLLASNGPLGLGVFDHIRSSIRAVIPGGSNGNGSSSSRKSVSGRYSISSAALAEIAARPEPSVRDLALRKDLILFIISEDAIFEEFFRPILDAHGLYFNNRCILSKCVEFDSLLDQFAKYVDENIRGWNAKTVENLMLKVRKEFGIFPWEITSLRHPQCENMIISNVPEDIQIQLNIHIGLKKIPARNERYSTENIRRVFVLNKKIASAVGKAYETIAIYYSQVLNDVIEKQMKEREAAGQCTHVLGTIFHTVGAVTTFGGRAIKRVSQVVMRSNHPTMLDDITIPSDEGSTAASSIDGGSNSTENDLLFFILSIINDGDRFLTQRIPEAMMSFLNEYLDNSSEGKEEEKEDRVIVNGEKGVRAQFEEAFSRSIGATNNLITEAINALSNEVLFSVDVEPVFLDAIEKVLSVSTNRNTIDPLGLLLSLPFEIPTLIADAVIRQRKEDREKLREISGQREEEEEVNNDEEGNDADQRNAASEMDRTESSLSETRRKPSSSSFGGEEDEGLANVSPIEVLLATLRDFYQFSGNYTTTLLLSRIVRMCVSKLIVRYLVMLRDALYRGMTNDGHLLSPLLAVPVAAIGGGVVTVGKAVATVLTRGRVATSRAAEDDFAERENLVHSVLNAAQVAILRRDMVSIVNAQRQLIGLLHDDDAVMDLLGFFCKALTDVLVENCDATGLEQRLWIRFRARCPAYHAAEVNSDPMCYKQALRRFSQQPFTLRGRTRDEFSQLNAVASESRVAIELSNLAVHRMPFGRLVMLRAAVGRHTSETKITMPTFSGSDKDLITWDLQTLKLEAQSSEADFKEEQMITIKLLDIRPLRTITLATLKLSLYELQNIVGYEAGKSSSSSTTATIWLPMIEGKSEEVVKTVPSDVARKDIPLPQIRMTIRLIDKAPSK